MRSVSEAIRVALLLGASALSGCAADTPQPVVQIRLETPSVPGGLLTCKTAPAVPGKTATQRTVSTYLVNLHAAHRDCHDKLGAVKKVLSDNEAAVTAQNAQQDAQPAPSGADTH